MKSISCFTLRDLTEACFNSRWAATKDEDRAMALLQDLGKTVGGSTWPSTAVLIPYDGGAQAIVDKYQAEMVRRGYKGGTWNRRCSMLSVLFRYALVRGWIAEMPEIRKRKESPGRTRVLSRTEEAMITNVWPRDRNETLFEFLLNTGMRLSEALALRWDDFVDLHERGSHTATVRDSKSGKTRTVPLNQAAVRAYKFAMDRTTAGPWSSVKARTFQRTVERLAAGCGIEGVTPHTLRHTFATRLVQAGASIVVVQRLLGHSSVAVTMRYAHAKQEDLQAAVSLI